MHKLILSFKGKIQKVFLPEAGKCLIGRQPDCDIQIDNLAVEPSHAIIHFSTNEARISALQKENRLLINNKKTQDTQDIGLKPGDEITIGKHTLVYLWDSKPQEESTSTSKATAHTHKTAWIQMMNGPKMGRTMQLKLPSLRIGTTKDKGVLITARNGGYYLSHLGDDSAVAVNNQQIGSSNIHLQDGNTIRIGDMEMLFYTQEQ